MAESENEPELKQETAIVPVTGKDVLQRHRRNIYDLQQEVQGLQAWKRRVELRVPSTAQQVLVEAFAELIVLAERGKRMVLDMTYKMGEKCPRSLADTRPKVTTVCQLASRAEPHPHDASPFPRRRIWRPSSWTAASCPCSGTRRWTARAAC